MREQGSSGTEATGILHAIRRCQGVSLLPVIRSDQYRDYWSLQIAGLENERVAIFGECPPFLIRSYCCLTISSCWVNEV